MTNQNKILIIDDEKEILKSFSLWIENEGFTVFTADSGAKAIEVLKKHPVEVCLVDLKLGDENGIELARELKERDKFLKIIIITGYPSYNTAVESIKSGIFDYISKSELQREILAKINRAIESRNELLGELNKDLNNRYKLALVCNHTLVREGFINFCKSESEFSLVHTFHSFNFIKKSDFNNEISIVLLCPSCNSEHFNTPKNLTYKLHTFFPNAKIVITEDNIEDESKINLIKYGVSGFLRKNISKENLKRAFRSILKNEFWISRKLNERLIFQLIEINQNSRKVPNTENVFNLSAREIEILEAISSGLTNNEIGEKFFISEKTVKAHVYNLFKKMGVNSRTQAVKKALDVQIL